MGPRAPSAKPAAPPTRTGATNIWDDGGVDVDPESVRPPPPVHAIAEARAQGAPGMKKKTAPKPPSPKRPRSLPAEAEEPTIPISTDPPAAEDTPIFEAPQLAPLAPLSIPAVEEFTKAPALTPIDTTPTIPREATAPAPSKPAEAATTSVPPAPEKRRSLLPFVFLGAAAAALALAFFLRKPPESAVSSTPESEHATAAPAPTHAPVATTTATAEPGQATTATAEPGQATATVATPTDTAPKAPPPSAVSTPRSATTETTAKATNPTTVVATTALPAPKEPKSTTPTKPETAAKSEPASKPEPAPKPETTKPVAAAPAQPQVSDVGGDFDKAAASAALNSAAGVASGCRKPGDPTGVAVVHITFANSGRATRALVEGPPFAGTPTGGCIAEALRSVRVPPYGGDRVTVTKRVVIQ